MHLGARRVPEHTALVWEGTVSEWGTLMWGWREDGRQMASGEDRRIKERVSAWRGNAERLRAALLPGDVNQSNDGRLSM